MDACISNHVAAKNSYAHTHTHLCIHSNYRSAPLAFKSKAVSSAGSQLSTQVFSENLEFNFKLQILLRECLDSDLESAEVMMPANLPAIMLPLKVTLSAKLPVLCDELGFARSASLLYGSSGEPVSCVLNYGNGDYVYFPKSFPSTLCEMKLVLIVIGKEI